MTPVLMRTGFSSSSSAVLGLEYHPLQLFRDFSKARVSL